MEWNGLTGLLYGLLGGFFEFLPVSPQVHQAVFCKLLGLEEPGYGLMLAVHVGCLAAVILATYEKITKLYRERKIEKIPPRRRKRQPDIQSLIELKLLKIGAVPLLISCLLAPWLYQHFGRLWILAIMAIMSGICILVPQYMSKANKDARSLSPLDTGLMGLGGMLGAIPGFSRVGMVTAVGSMRGADGRYCMDFTFLLCIPGMLALCIGDVAMLVMAGGAMPTFFCGALACIASFGAAYGAIRFMRFLAVKNSFDGFAYYQWGLGIFTFIIYLIG